MTVRLQGLLLLSCLVGGCGTVPEATQYLLEPMAALSANPVVSLDQRVGVGPIQLAAYLDERRLLGRRGSILMPDSAHLWAAPLTELLGQVIHANFVRALGAQQVSRFPWPRNETDQPKWQLSVFIERFDADLDRAQMVLSARWQLKTVPDGRILNAQYLELREPLASFQGTEVSTAGNTLLARFTMQVVASLPREQ